MALPKAGIVAVAIMTVVGFIPLAMAEKGSVMAMPDANSHAKGVDNHFGMQGKGHDEKENHGHDMEDMVGHAGDGLLIMLKGNVTADKVTATENYLASMANSTGANETLKVRLMVVGSITDQLKQDLQNFVSQTTDAHSNIAIALHFAPAKFGLEEQNETESE